MKTLTSIQEWLNSELSDKQMTKVPTPVNRDIKFEIKRVVLKKEKEVVIPSFFI